MREPPVLIVEDDPDVSASLQLLVESYFRVPTTVVEDGVRALDLARTVAPRLILLDLALPGLDGLAVCAQLKGSDQTRHLPIIAVSSSPWGLEETRRRADEAGCDGFYHKLYDFHRLLPLLARYLGEAGERGPAEVDDETGGPVPPT